MPRKSSNYTAMPIDQLTDEKVSKLVTNFEKMVQELKKTEDTYAPISGQPRVSTRPSQNQPNPKLEGSVMWIRKAEPAILDMLRKAGVMETQGTTVREIELTKQVQMLAQQKRALEELHASHQQKRVEMDNMHRALHAKMTAVETRVAKGAPHIGHGLEDRINRVEGLTTASMRERELEQKVLTLEQQKRLLESHTSTQAEEFKQRQNRCERQIQEYEQRILALESSYNSPEKEAEMQKRKVEMEALHAKLSAKMETVETRSLEGPPQQDPRVMTKVFELEQYATQLTQRLEEMMQKGAAGSIVKTNREIKKAAESTRSSSEPPPKKPAASKSKKKMDNLPPQKYYEAPDNYTEMANPGQTTQVELEWAGAWVQARGGDPRQIQIQYYQPPPAPPAVATPAEVLPAAKYATSPNVAARGLEAPSSQATSYSLPAATAPLEEAFSYKIKTVETLTESLAFELARLENKVSQGGFASAQLAGASQMQLELQMQNEQLMIEAQRWKAQHEEQYQARAALQANYERIEMDLSRAHDIHDQRARELEMGHETLKQQIDALNNQNHAHVQNIQNLTLQLQQPASPPKVVESGSSAREVELNAMLLEAKGERDHWQNQHTMVMSQHQQVLEDAQHWQNQHQLVNVEVQNWQTQHQQVVGEYERVQAEYEKLYADHQAADSRTPSFEREYQQAVADLEAHARALQERDAEILKMGELSEKVMQLEQMLGLKQQEVDLVTQQMNEVSMAKTAVEQELLVEQNMKANTAGDVQQLMADMSTMEQFREGLQNDVNALNERLVAVSQMGPTHEAHQELYTKYNDATAAHQQAVLQYEQANARVIELEQAQTLRTSLTPTSSPEKTAMTMEGAVLRTSLTPTSQPNSPEKMVASYALPTAAPVVYETAAPALLSPTTIVTEQAPVVIAEQRAPMLVTEQVAPTVVMQQPTILQGSAQVKPTTPTYTVPTAYGSQAARTMSNPAGIQGQFSYDLSPVQGVSHYSAAAHTVSKNATRYAAPTTAYATGTAATGYQLQAQPVQAYGERYPVQSTSVTAPIIGGQQVQQYATYGNPLPANRVRRLG